MTKRSISPFALLLTSVSAILGSGWLFVSYYTAELAGPSAILSWLIGGFTAVIIAFVFAELCAMLPITGSSTRIPYYTHGTLISFLFLGLSGLPTLHLLPQKFKLYYNILVIFLLRW